MTRVCLLLTVSVLVGQTDARSRADQLVATLMSRRDVADALSAAKALEPQTLETQVRLAEIPAPPFKEATRGDAVKRLFQQVGLRNVRTDRVGNVIGDRPGSLAHPHVVIAAHLDTVFPEGTDVRVKRDGRVLRGPGIGDDSRGLAMLVAMAQSLDQAKVRTKGTLTFVADVGEEGLGDLRGMKELFGTTLKGEADRFVTLDGSGMGLASTFVASRRYRVTYRGPGGHSFGAFGLPNPAGALGRAIAKISNLSVPVEPRTTFNIGRIGGGTSVNAIPVDAWMELDLRSVSPRELAALDAKVQAALTAALMEENARGKSSGVLTLTKELAGERPAGETSADSLIVQRALAATRALGRVPQREVSSTDANYPASLRIPAIEIGTGGIGADAHAPTESFDTTDSWLGTERAVLLAIALTED